ncbi:MAG: glycerol-3-phosphate 1-O-acyltransferase PlsY [Eubacteriales bacterium]
MVRCICIVIGYLLGLIQTGYIYGRIKGIDIRQYGSGNAGSTNALRTLGKKAGLIVLTGDIIKCIIAVVLVRVLLPQEYQHMKHLYMLYAALGAILGHNYPFYLGFKGGKGIAATIGLVAAFDVSFLIVALILFFTGFLITHYVSLGSLLVYAGFMIQLIVAGEMGLLQYMEPTIRYELYIIGAFLTIMAYWKHRENIVRLWKGTERKTYIRKTRANG